MLRCVRSLFALALLSISVPAANAHTTHHDIYQLEVSPRYDHDRTLYVIVRGNLLRSIDGGNHWKRLVKGLDHKHILSSLQISPSSPDILYLSSLGDGIFKSEDQGLSWARANEGLPTGNIHLLGVSPSSSETVLAAATTGGLFRTADGGHSWHPVLDKDETITAIGFHPEDAARVAVGDRAGQVYRSFDAGLSWQRLSSADFEDPIAALVFPPERAASRNLLVATQGGRLYRVGDDTKSVEELPIGTAGQPITGLAVSPDYPRDGTILASTWRAGVIRSGDRGKTWRSCGRGLSTHEQARQFMRPDFSELEIPNARAGDRTMFLAGFDGLFVSPEGDCTWNQLATLSPETITGLGVSPDYSEDSTVGIGTYLWGIYLSTDRGRTWAPSHSGLAEGRWNGIARVFDIVFSPNYKADGSIFSATWWIFLKSTDRGRRWEKLNPGGGGYTIAVSPDFESDGTLYVGTMQGHILRSTDRGSSLSLIADVPRRVSSLVISPAFGRDRTLFVGETGAVHRSTDGGLAWHRADRGVEFGSRSEDDTRPFWMWELDDQATDVQLAISPAFEADDTVFAGTSEGLFRSADAGELWERVFPVSSRETGIIEGVALSPSYAEDGIVLLSVRGRGLFRSVDRGQTFVEIGRELIENNHLLANSFGFPLADSVPIKFSPSYADDQTIFGFSEANVFRSEDGGGAWQALTVPMPDYDLWTVARLRYLRHKNSRLVRGGAALLTGAAVFFALGHPRIQRELSPHPFRTRAAGAIIATVIVLISLLSL